MNRKLITTILCGAMFLSLTLTGCGSKKDIGTIKDMSSSSSESSQNEASTLKLYSRASENGTGFDMMKFDDYYAGFSVPFPRGFELTVNAANDITLYNQKKDITIYMAHTPFILAHSTTSTTGFNLEALHDSSDYKVRNQRFYIDNISYGRYVDQTLEEPRNGKEAYKPAEGYIVDVQDYPELRLTRNGSLTHERAFERRYYIEKNEVYTLLSVVAPVEYTDQAKKIADYMFDNMKPETENFHKVKVDLNGVTLKIPDVYRKVSVSNETLGNGVAAVVPVRSSSSLAGSFIAVFDYDKTWEYSPNDIFGSVYSEIASNMDNVEITGYVENEETVYHWIKNSKTSDFDLGHITIMRTGDAGTPLIEHGDSWSIEKFVVDTGIGKKIVFIGYNSAKENDIIRAFS